MARKRNRELEEQALLVKWFRLKHPGDVLIVSASGGSRHKLEAFNLKRSGLVRGIPDLFLPVGSERSHGLWIEFKRTRVDKEPKARVSLEQKIMLGYLRRRGYCAEVCWGLDQAMELIDSYMEKGYVEGSNIKDLG